MSQDDHAAAGISRNVRGHISLNALRETILPISVGATLSAPKKPLIVNNFADARAAGIVEHWKKIFSDKSKFNLFGYAGRKHL